MLFRGMVVAGAMAVMLAAPSVAQAQCANENAPVTSISAAEAADALNCVVNEERAAAGKVTLTRNGKLTRIADAQAAFNVAKGGDLSHIDGDGGNPSDRATTVGYNWKAVGENLVLATTAREAVDIWLGDGPHRRNVLKSKYRNVGAGVALDGDSGLAVFCQVYGVKK